MATTGNPPASRTRARLVCSGHTHTGNNILLSEPLSDHAHARARARRRQFTEAEVAAWRERIFANGLEDPVKVAVEEAVRDFGRPEDFTLWAWYANRIGVNSFVELYFEQLSGINLGDRPRDLASNLQIFACYLEIMRHFKTDTLGTDPAFSGQGAVISS